MQDTLVNQDGLLSKGHKRLLFMAVILFVLTIVGIVIFNFFQQNVRTVLQIGDVKYTQNHYKKIIKQATELGWSKANANNELIEAEKTVQTAKKLKVIVDDNDVLKALSNRFSIYELKQADEWQLPEAQKGAYQKKMLLVESGGYQGAVMEFPYSRNFDTYSINDVGKDFRNPQAIEADKVYALQKANEYHDKLINKKIVISKAIKNINDDNRLILGSSGNKSKEFFVNKQGAEIEDIGNNRFTSNEYLPELTTLKNGEVSSIKTKKMLLSYYDTNDTKEPKDVAYYFIYLSSSIDPNPNIKLDFKTAFDAIKVINNV